MRIVALNYEIVRATPAVAEFIVHIELDGPSAGCEVAGHAVGPQCPDVSTVEVTYSMSRATLADCRATLRCVIPEPNLWTPDAPFTYGVVVEVRLDGKPVDARSGIIAFRTD
jgi:glycosyl hydrolase family 2